MSAKVLREAGVGPTAGNPECATAPSHRIGSSIGRGVSFRSAPTGLLSI